MSSGDLAQCFHALKSAHEDPHRAAQGARQSRWTREGFAMDYTDTAKFQMSRQSELDGLFANAITVDFMAPLASGKQFVG